MISLIDGQYQYILAEATSTTSLRLNPLQNKDLDILLGNVCVPRNWGLCELVLDPVAVADGDPGIIIIKDLSLSEQHANRSYVKGDPHFRFYAGVPIQSPNGTVVGSMCIFDGPERTGMAPEDILYLQDLAATVMEYLVTYTLKDQHRRGAEGLHGLITFAESDPKPQPFYKTSPGYPAQPSPKVARNSRDSGVQVSPEESEEGGELKGDSPTCDDAAQSKPLPISTDRSERRPSVGDLQDMVLPDTMKDLFARAADIMRRSNDMDGVMFLDAMVAATSINGGDKSPTRAR